MIVHADVVGSTALIQKNKSLAHARIRDAFGGTVPIDEQGAIGQP